jgi:hypothetical protein
MHNRADQVATLIQEAISDAGADLVLQSETPPSFTVLWTDPETDLDFTYEVSVKETG